ncbi:MAG: MerR family transcriptional regulator [Microbacterium sp.]|jgi:DNA-binding transcriptional MerR regulator|nr:MerR family transcriptional regulator [Microbacterium sp.]
MLTIGELASYAGVTVRSIRHYHAKGLLPEPERDRAGYRRYDADSVVDLIRIRMLAEAGVPLSRVRALLCADQEQFSAAITEIDGRLRAEIEHRTRLRARIAGLVAGEDVALPRELVDFVEALRGIGVDERIIRVERDGWLPLFVRSPEDATIWILQKQEQLRSPELRDLYLVLGRALDDEPDDAALAALADGMAMYLERMADAHGVERLYTQGVEPPLAEMLDALAFDSWPTAERLAELMTQRGWDGWSSLKRIPPSRR